MLLSKGVDVNSKDKSRVTPLLIAVRTGDAAMVELLLSHGAKTKTRVNGLSPLHEAASKNNVKCLKYVVVYIFLNDHFLRRFYTTLGLCWTRVVLKWM